MSVVCKHIRFHRSDVVAAVGGSIVYGLQTSFVLLGFGGVLEFSRVLLSFERSIFFSFLFYL